MINIPLEALPIDDEECDHLTFGVVWRENDGDMKGDFACLCVRKNLQIHMKFHPLQ